MTHKHSTHHRSGFTLIEILVVIVVIAILAIIVIPRLLSAARQGREAALSGDLHELRAAIEQFNADMGDFPASLDQLVLPHTTPPSGNGGTGVVLDPQAYKGPYLRNPDEGLVKDPFTGAADWNYTPNTGEVSSSSTLTSLKGTPYSSW